MTNHAMGIENNESDEFRLRKTDIGTEELVFPDGSTEWTETLHEGKCTVAATIGENAVAVFVDGEHSRLQLMNMCRCSLH